jgi:hypothetical protein
MSGNDLVPHHTHAVIIPGGPSDPFVMAFQPAQPTLDAMIELRHAFRWLADGWPTGGDRAVRSSIRSAPQI